MKVLRRGFTTGTAAAAATKAAIYRMAGQALTEVMVTLPDGFQIKIPIKDSGAGGSEGFYAEVVKDGGDDPDVTHGIIIKAIVKRFGDSIQITGGTGVGRVTKPGLPVVPGEAAINPVPRSMIHRAILESPVKNGLLVRIEVPQGEQVAKKTLNPRLGIVGGISILGTTGFVEPMSNEAWQLSLTSQLKVIRAVGFETVILTPGRQGLHWAVEQGLPEAQVAEMSNFVGFMLDQCMESGFQAVLLWGHFGKLIKVAAGNFNTHSHVSDAKLETLTAIAALCGGDLDLIQQIFNANTTEEAVGYLTAKGMDREVLDKVAERASFRASERIKGLQIGCILLDRQGRIRGSDPGANKILEAERWRSNWS